MAFRDLLATLFAPSAETRFRRLEQEARDLISALSDVSDKLMLAVARQAKRDVRQAQKALDTGASPAAPREPEIAGQLALRLPASGPERAAAKAALLRGRINRNGVNPLTQGPPEAHGDERQG